MLDNSWIEVSFDWLKTFSINDIKLEINLESREVFFNSPDLPTESWVEIIKKLLTPEEDRLVNNLEKQWLLLVWFTNESWRVPNYITEVLKIRDWSIILQPRYTENWIHNGKSLVFVKLTWIEAIITREWILKRVEQILN